MAEDFLRYEAMRDSGVDPQVVYQEAKNDGLDAITCIRLLPRLMRNEEGYAAGARA